MKWFLLIATTSLLIMSILLLLAWGLHQYYQDRYLYGISVANIKLGGLNKVEARKIIQSAVDDYKKNGLSYIYDNNKINLQTSITSSELATSYDIINFNIDQTLEQLWLLGHENGYSANFWQQIKHALVPRHYPLLLDTDTARLKNMLITNFQKYATPGSDALPIITDGQVQIKSHSLGTTFAYDDIIKKTNRQVSYLDNSPLNLSLALDLPIIMDKDISPADIKNLEQWLTIEKTLSLTAPGQSWQISQPLYQDWIHFTKKEGAIIIAFNTDALADFLQNTVAVEIDKEPQDAKFQVANGRVTEFQSSQDGQKLNIPASITAINDNFFQPDSEANQAIELIVTPLTAKVAVADTNDLGIRDVIGVGRSDFHGSPANRVHNIQTGANAINGLIIKPGETFSLITALGDINASTGYLPELVIKGNKTIPEYGGGLCQIGTTTFRAAIDTGLPIVERRNHSYRVSYYEPAGFDATIYDPKPDLRFTNDTNNNILIQTRIEGTELIFEFWGTPDGRIVNYTTPKIYNITSPGETKYVDTTELEPGEIKCTERAHNGADADFDYNVLYPNGEEKSTNFFSHYVAWPEVCLRGVEPEVPDDTANDSQSDINDSTGNSAPQ
ncbi:MAG: VanW family protein [Candidatus Komeilibacteria bacterium]